ncbi:MAG: molecular chaperone DnaJ [Pseudomonadota bacterium]
MARGHVSSLRRACKCPGIIGPPARSASRYCQHFPFMTMDFSSSSGIRIAEPNINGPVCRTRKQFNALIKKLEAERMRLAAWHEALPAIRRQVEEDYLPLTQAFDEQRKALIKVFDQACSHKAIGKKERAKLTELITSIGIALLDAGDDDEVRDIFNRHAGGDGVFGTDEFAASIKDIAQDMFGVRFDDDVDLASPEALFKAMSEKMAAQQQEAQAQGRKPAKPAKPSARETRQQAEQQRLQQSVRDIFRKLASALHPDREPDEVERVRKTALMQRVNAAYAANDLLGLLELQLEVEQIDQAALDRLGEDRIKMYNKILDSQVRELQRETHELEYSLMRETQQPRPRQLTPKTLLMCLHADIAEMQRNVDTIAQDVGDFQDIRALKAWLKDYQIPAVSYPDEYYF